MASGDTNITICNQALNLLGADTISSFSDTSNDAAAVCNNIYETIKRQTLSMYPWSFALTKLQLTKSGTSPIGEWDNRFDLPSTAVAGQPFQVYNTDATGSMPITSYELQYTSSGPAIFTNETTIYIDYITSAITEGLMPSYFVQLLVYMMAWHLAEPVTDQTTKADYWKNIAVGTPSESGRGGYFRQAANADGRGKTSYAIHEFPLTDVR